MIKIKERENIGTAKYVVSYSTGWKTHRDGSEFWEVAIFKNKKDKEKFVKELKEKVTFSDRVESQISNYLDQAVDYIGEDSENWEELDEMSEEQREEYTEKVANKVKELGQNAIFLQRNERDFLYNFVDTILKCNTECFKTEEEKQLLKKISNKL